jgi:aspartate racemase
MKTIGLIGGMSWESTITYYRVINQTIKEKLGGFHSAKCILVSVDFQEIEQCQADGDWGKSAAILSEAARALEKAGADFIVICTNTMHKIAPEIRKSIHLPILHIAEMTAIELKKAGITRVGLLGTKYTMQQDFYKQVLIDNGIEVIIPEEKEIQIVNTVIYDELCLGIISGTSKQEYLKIISGLTARGAQGVILGCTEIGLLVDQEDTSTRLFDTTMIHAKSAALESITDTSTHC